VVEGVRGAECLELVKRFFEQRRLTRPDGS